MEGFGKEGKIGGVATSDPLAVDKRRRYSHLPGPNQPQPSRRTGLDKFRLPAILLAGKHIALSINKHEP